MGGGEDEEGRRRRGGEIVEGYSMNHGAAP